MQNIAKLNYLCNDGKAECVNAWGCVLGLDFDDFARVTSAGLRMQYTVDRRTVAV